ncbi:hypothetical protein BSKO_04373 [Bryopsis sp. KO-2023]|nr:hypothetical protein BSKO_04373 [Bryopsis sp. KO-2023]
MQIILDSASIRLVCCKWILVQQQVRLSVEEAHRARRITPADLHRLQTLVRQARLVSKSRSEDAENWPPLKRPRRNKESELPKEPRGQAPFYAKCLRVLEKVVVSMGIHGATFTQPVDQREVPDYYQIVKNPVDLGTIKQRLLAGVYQTPQEFENDVRLVWSNCFLYNKRGCFVDGLGRKAEATFNRSWAMSGLGSPQSLTSAGRARSSGRGRGGKRGRTPSTKHHTKMMDGSPLGPLESHFKGIPAAGGACIRLQMTTTGMQDLVDGITSIIGRDKDAQQEILNLVKESNPVDEEEGEVELDIGELDNETLWKLKDYIDRYRHHERLYGPKEPSCGKVVVNKDSSSDSSSSDSSDSD